MYKKNILINHYEVLGEFSNKYYQDIITKDHLGEESVISVAGKNGDKEQTFIYPVKYQGKVYAIRSKIIEKEELPIKIILAKKLAYRTTVYHLVKKYSSVKIVPQKTMTFRKLIHTIADFEHSNKEEFILYIIVMMYLYLRKGFVRIVSKAAFGKNSVPTILKILMKDISIINPKSTPAFEHRLISKLIVLDELTNLEKGHISSMQDSLLKVADGSPFYEKSTRKSSKLGTKDEYNISKLSIAITYNIFEYYDEVGQGEKYFDNIFQYAVKSRFLPLYFDGILNSMQFLKLDKPGLVADKLKDDIKDIIKAIKYFGDNFEKEDNDFQLRKEYILSKEGRIDKTFYGICQALRIYANNENEYNDLVERLYKCHKRYINMLKTEVKEVDINAPIKKSNQTQL